MRLRSASLCVALVLASCAAPAPPRDVPNASGGTVILAWQEPSTLDPLYSTGTATTATITALAVEGLVRVGPEGDAEPALASAVPTLANGGVRLVGTEMEVTYRLRDGLVWSDGEPVTSEDVRYTWQAVMSDPKVTSREGYDLIGAIDVPDVRTVVIRFRQIYAGYLTRFDAILPAHLLREKGDAARLAYGRAPLGTGPFRIVTFAAGDHIVAQRNERYRTPGKPLLDTVIFRFVPSVEVAKAQLRAGEVDVALNVSEADAIELERAGIRLDSAPSPTVEALSFNTVDPREPDARRPHPVLGDRAVRRALLLATPKQELIDRLLGGRAAPGRSEIPLGWSADPQVVQERADPAAAARVLDAAGWTLGADGIRTKAGVRATIAIMSTTGNKLREQIQQVLVDRWRDAGIAATIRNIPSSALTASWSSGGARKRGEFDVVLANLGLGSSGATDPQAYLAQRHRCDAIPTGQNKGAGSNFERFCDPQVDRLLEGAGRTIDQQRRREAYARVNAIVNEQVLAIWLYEKARINAFGPKIVGDRANVWSVATWNVEDWRLARR